MSKPLLLELKAAHEHFRDVQNKLTNFGAGDSEPDGEYEEAVRQALHGLPFKPLSAEEWQLYTCSMKCDMAAKRLNHALQRVVNTISVMTLAERPAVMVWVKTWAWRVDMEGVPSPAYRG